MKCKTCIYRRSIDGICGCGYMLATGDKRSDLVKVCSKYRRGQSIAKKTLKNAYSSRVRKEDKNVKN